MIPLFAWSERRIRIVATTLHDLAGRPFHWLIHISPIRHWLRRTDPNSWSLVRLPLSFIITLLLRGAHDAAAIATLVLALLTDRLDGELARATNRCTPLGERIDTFVDAAMLAAVMLGLADRLPTMTVGPLTLSIAPVMVVLEAARLLGGFLLGSWSQTVPERAALAPNLSGKYKMAAFGLGAFLLLLRATSAAMFCLSLAAGLSLYSAVRHISDWLIARAHRHVVH